MRNNEANCELLLRNGVLVNTSDNAGITPLHLAVRNCSIDIVKLFLNQNADIHAKDKDGLTPIDYEGYETDWEIIELLLSRGAIRCKCNKEVYVDEVRRAELEALIQHNIDAFGDDDDE